MGEPQPDLSGRRSQNQQKQPLVDASIRFLLKQTCFGTLQADFGRSRNLDDIRRRFTKMRWHL
jgi:hypothetical protein